MRILVTGATGYIGSRLVPELEALGHQVRCLARDPKKLESRGLRNVEIVKGDVLEPATLLTALAGMQAAYYLVHSMNGSGGGFAEKDRIAARNFAQAAADCGVSRIFYLGGLGDGTGLSEHLRSRQESGEILRQGSVPVTELRAAIIVGSGSASFEIIRDLARKLPFMICPRWVSSRCEPIAIRDVLAYLTGVLDEPRTTGRVLEIGGGEIHTYKDLMKICAEVMGRRVWILTVPFLTPRLSAYWLNLVTAVPMSIAYPLVEGLRNDVVCKDHTIRALIPRDLLPYREAVSRSLAREQQAVVPSRWTEASTEAAAEPWNEQACLLSDRRVIETSLSEEELFSRVRRIGGETGWYYANVLWHVRGAMDRIAGGVGMRRGRRDPVALRVGDAVDFWRVERFEDGRLLGLRAEMKVPGQARLTFKVSPRPGGGSTLTQLAEFHPSGLLGRAYWYALVPIHALVFEGMARGIAKP